MNKSNNYVGLNIKIASGTRVHREGKPTIQKRTSVVTVRKQEVTPSGKTRIIWNSMGYRASTVISN